MRSSLPSSYDPTFLEAAREAFAARRYRDAIALLNSILRVDRNCVDAYFLAGQSCEALKRYRAAFEHYSHVVRCNRSHKEARLKKAALLRLAGNHALARKEVQGVLSLGVNNARAFYEWGRIELEAKKYGQAIRLLQRALSIDAANKELPKGEYYYSLGLAFKAAGNLLSASRYFLEAVTHMNDHEEAWRAAADVYGMQATVAVDSKIKQQKYEGAFFCLNHVIRINPNNVPACYYRALSYFYQQEYSPVDERKDYSRAIEYFSEVIAKWDAGESVPVKELWWRTFYFRGQAKQKMKDYRSALSDFNEVLWINPQMIRARLELARCLVELTQYEDAQLCLETWVGPECKEVDPLLLLARAKFGSNRHEESLVDCQVVLQLQPGNREATELKRLIEQARLEAIRSRMSAAQERQAPALMSSAEAMPALLEPVCLQAIREQVRAVHERRGSALRSPTAAASALRGAARALTPAMAAASPASLSSPASVRSADSLMVVKIEPIGEPASQAPRTPPRAEKPGESREIVSVGLAMLTPPPIFSERVLSAAAKNAARTSLVRRLRTFRRTEFSPRQAAEAVKIVKGPEALLWKAAVEGASPLYRAMEAYGETMRRHGM
ncbi:MAG TPA: tetratricopeptide repeat protein [Coxiellaceae bacterium]|nr:tetratricopeptide repeat protein [Coxiellaceae bacterium]